MITQNIENKFNESAKKLYFKLNKQLFVLPVGKEIQIGDNVFISGVYIYTAINGNSGMYAQIHITNSDVYADVSLDMFDVKVIYRLIMLMDVASKD